MRRPWIVLLLVLSMSCSVAFQDSVRSSGTQCSTSRFWWVSDLLIAGTFAALVANIDGPPESYIPAGVFVGSGLIGIYKRGNCVRYRETAPPEAWARDAERARVKDEQQAAAMRDLRQSMNEPPPPPPPPPASTGGYEPAPTYGTSPPPSGDVTVTYERHSAADEVGKSCSSANDTDRELPTAGTCQYGAVCYQGRCTTWCGSGGACPSGLSCGWTDGRTKMQVCR